MDTWWGSNYILQPLVHTPGLWFIINIALWCSIACVPPPLCAVALACC